LREDAEALAGAPGTTLQVEPFHSSINVSKPSPLAATRVWPTAQASVWEAAKTPFSWEAVLPAGFGLLSTCHDVPAASAGDAAISAAAAPPATASSARRIFTDSPLLALAALYVRADTIGHEPYVVDCSNIWLWLPSPQQRGRHGHRQRTTRTSVAAPAQDLKRLLPLVKRLPGDPHNIFLSAPAPVPSQP
jgi:hypothetical protein